MFPPGHRGIYESASGDPGEGSPVLRTPRMLVPENGELRDVNEVFSALLSVDSYLPNREVGLALFREQAPFMKKRILGFIKGKSVKVREKTGKKIEIPGGKGKKKKMIDEVKITEKVDTVLGKINSGFEKQETVVLTKDDWEIISEHICGLGSVFRDYNLLRESLGL